MSLAATALVSGNQDERLAIRQNGDIAMRLTIAAALALLVVCSMGRGARAETASACKECSDHRKRCMANYPGPTCKVDYDICIKACRKK